jgi:hypothetical protein
MTPNAMATNAMPPDARNRRNAENVIMILENLGYNLIFEGVTVAIWMPFPNGVLLQHTRMNLILNLGFKI